MLTVNALVAIIAGICHISDPNWSKDQKLDCSEFMVNCSVIGKGEIPEKQVKFCEEKFHGKK